MLEAVRELATKVGETYFTVKVEATECENEIEYRFKVYIHGYNYCTASTFEAAYIMLKEVMKLDAPEVENISVELP